MDNDPGHLFFETPEDFFLQMRKIERDNFNLLTIYDRNLNEILILRKEKEGITAEEQEANKFLSKEIQKKENELEIIKKRHKDLLEEKRYINSLFEKGKKIWLVDETKEVSKRIFEIYVNAVKNTNPPEKVRNLSFKLKKLHLSNIQKLGMIENILNKVISGINLFLKEDTQKNLALALKIVEKNHIRSKYLKEQRKEEEKMRKLREKILKDQNNPMYLPFRKVDKYYYLNMRDKVKEKEKVNRTTGNDTVEDDEWDEKIDEILY